MMSFEEMLEEYLMEEKVENEYQMIFGECETSEEITLKMKEVTEKVLMKDQTHLTHRFAQARLNFMVEEKERLFQEMFLEKSLMKHLLEVEETAKRFMEMEKSRMMESFGLTEELKAEDWMKWTGLMENLNHELREMAMKEYVYN
ncbi:TPA: TnpV protein [Clostridioides difficile]